MIEKRDLRGKALLRAAKEDGVEAEANAWIASVAVAAGALTASWATGVLLAVLPWGWNLAAAMPLGVAAALLWGYEGRMTYRILQVLTAERRVRRAQARVLERYRATMPEELLDLCERVQGASPSRSRPGVGHENVEPLAPRRKKS